MGDALLVWGLGLLALGLMLGVAEMFVPSGGALGVSAGLCAIAGVVVLFVHEPLWGGIGTVAVIIGAPVLISFAFKVWPHTPLGKRIIGIPTEEEAAAVAEEAAKERARDAALIGKEGVVVSDLRPVGTVVIDGIRHDALTDTTYTPAGTRVKVLAVAGAQIKVRALGVGTNQSRG